MESMLTRYIHEAMKRARYKSLENGACFGEIPGLAGVWANESTANVCRKVLQEVLEEWLVLKIRDNDPISRIGRVGLSSRMYPQPAAQRHHRRFACEGDSEPEGLIPLQPRPLP